MSAGDRYTVFVPVPTTDAHGKDLPPSALKKRFLSANVERASHWTLRAKIAAAWRHATMKAAEEQAPGLRLERVHVTAFFVKPRSGPYDPANLSPVMKACVDGLVDAYVVEDDDRTRVVGPDPRHGGTDPERPGVVLHLEDLGRRTA